MGYMRHHAIIVTCSGYDSAEKCLREVHLRALKLFGADQVTPILPKAVNGHRSFFIGPDGSKEGWPESDDGNLARARFIDVLDQQRYGDGSSPLSWCEVEYAGDGSDCLVTRHRDEPSRRDRKGNLS